MLKHDGGKVQTGFTMLPNWMGGLQVAPPSVLLATKRPLPFPPCSALSKVRYSVPSGALVRRASWLLRTVPELTATGVENVRPPSREAATRTGECCRPLNWTQVTYTDPR